MYCPKDGNYLEPKNSKNDTYVLDYSCGYCGGKFISHPGSQNLTRHISRIDHHELLYCPRDNELLHEQSGNYICGICYGQWIPGKELLLASQKQLATILAFKIVSLFVLAIGLLSWQIGIFASSADPLIQTTLAPIKSSAIIIWFLIFVFIFLVPATIYEQMVLSHRPNLTRASHHPLVRFLPLIVIILMAINIYFLTP